MARTQMHDNFNNNSYTNIITVNNSSRFRKISFYDLYLIIAHRCVHFFHADKGTVQKVIVLPRDDLQTEELVLEEVEVFKVSCSFFFLCHSFSFNSTIADFLLTLILTRCFAYPVVIIVLLFSSERNTLHLQ